MVSRSSFPAVVIASAFLLSGCIIHVGGDSGDTSSVFGTVEISEGKQVGDVSSVNGGVMLYDDVVAGKIDSVNGDIEIGDRVTVRHATTVNGDIEAGYTFTSNGRVETVNGDIDLKRDSVVAGNIETVNGDINLTEVAIQGDVETHNGDVRLRAGSSVSGDIVFKRNKDRWQWGNNATPTLTIEENVTVGGMIVLHRPVELKLEDSALQDKVIERFDYR